MLFRSEEILKKYELDFDDVLKFIKKSSIYGFRRSHNPQTKRALFEAISVGTYLALRKNKNINVTPHRFAEIIDSPEFKPLWMGSNELHRPSKVKARIEFIENQLLG